MYIQYMTTYILYVVFSVFQLTFLCTFISIHIHTYSFQVRNVPGMGQFDIDGLDPERQAQLVGASNRILGAFTAVLLASAAGSFAVVMDKVFMQQVNCMNTYCMYLYACICMHSW